MNNGPAARQVRWFFMKTCRLRLLDGFFGRALFDLDAMTAERAEAPIAGDRRPLGPVRRAILPVSLEQTSALRALRLLASAEGRHLSFAMRTGERRPKLFHAHPVARRR